MDRTAPPPALRSGDAPFGLRDFVRVLDERRALIRNVTVGVVLLTAVVLFLLPTLYSSTAVVMLDQRKNNLADFASVLSTLPTDQSSVQNQIQLLTSRDLASQVIGKLKLYDDPEFASTGGAVLGLLNPLTWGRLASSPAGMRDAVVDAFLDRLDVSAVGLSTTIDVTFTAHNPATAALVANTLAQTYARDQVRTRIDAARRASQWLSDRMRQLGRQMQAQEAAVEEYKAAHNLVESDEGKSLVDQQLVAVNAQLIAARSDLAEKQATYDRVQALVKSGDTSDVSQIVSSALITQLRAQQADLVRQEADLMSRYGPNHPKMQAIRLQKRDLAAKIKEEAQRISGSIANDVAVARAHIASIEASLTQVEKQAQRDNVARIKLNALEANVASTRTMYESFVSRLRAVQDPEAVQISEVRVISRAPIPSAPSSPHRTLFLLASIPVGFLLGILAALLAERFEEPRRPPDVTPPLRAPAPDVPEANDTAVPVSPVPRAQSLPPILAELPVTTDMQAANWAIGAPDTVYGRALSALVDRVAVGGRVVALVSSDEEAGRPVIALGLARLAARRGLRTILLDGDLNHPVLAAAVGHGAAPAGLGEVLKGSAPLSQAVLKDPRSGVFVLSVAPGTPSLWSSPKMTQLLDYLRRNCDLVILDSGPRAGLVPAMLADTVVVAVRSAAPQNSLEGHLRVLKAAGARVAGLVVLR